MQRERNLLDFLKNRSYMGEENATLTLKQFLPLNKVCKLEILLIETVNEDDRSFRII